MDFSKMDGNAFARSNAYTKTIYRDVYPAVDPSSPALSQRGKVVIVTGAGSGIGAQGIVPAFAMAGATGIVLVGRSRAKLQETAAAVHKQFPAVELLEVAADISEEKDVDMLFASAIAKFGHVDVLVNNASVLFELTHVEASDPIDWWTHFKINTLGTYLMNRMFLRVVGPEKQGAIVNMTSGASRVAIPGFSAYGLSKAAVNKLSEYPEVERPNINCVTLDPGAVRTDMVPKFLLKFAYDTPELVGGVCVWLATEAATFLRSRYMNVNWDVVELIARKDEILGGNDLKFGLQGTFGVSESIHTREDIAV